MTPFVEAVAETFVVCCIALLMTFVIVVWLVPLSGWLLFPATFVMGVLLAAGVVAYDGRAG